MRRIYGIGEIVLDILFKDSKPVTAVPGGSTFNSMLSLGRTVHRCGNDCEVIMISDMGDDMVGDMELEFMADNGMDSSFVLRHPHSQSPVSLAFLNERNDASYEFYRSAVQPELSLDSLERIPQFAPGDILLFGSFFAVNTRTRPLVKALLASAKESGAIIYYDVNFRANHIKDLPVLRQEIVDNMNMSTIVKMSADDARNLYGESEDLCAAAYAANPAPVFIMTDGSRPSQLISGGERKQFAFEAVKPVSTIGAGDNFNAGFIYGIVSEGLAYPDENYPWERLFASAAAFSREVCLSLENYVGKSFIL